MSTYITSDTKPIGQFLSSVTELKIPTSQRSYAASPVLLRYSTPERVYQNIILKSMGIQISDPSTYYLDGDARWAGETVLEGVALQPQRALNWQVKGAGNPRASQGWDLV